MSIATALPAGIWNIDTSHTTVGFTVRHMMVSKVRGKFSDFGGDIVIAEDPTASTVERHVEMASVDTGDAGRDDHLRTNDFFDIQTHPTMTFTSTEHHRARAATSSSTGDLTIQGVTRPVTFDLEVGGVGTDPWGNTSAGFTATTTINRKDLGLEYNAVLEGGGVLIGEKVTIELDVEATLAS